MLQLVRRFASEAASQHRLCQAYATLGLEEGAENVKERFLQLAKKFHPDSGSVEASVDKFIDIKRAYEVIARNTEGTEEQIGVDELIEKTIYDIRHKAPQHRQYLEFEGYGIGPPSKRHKQYQQYRVARAVERASEFIVDKTLAQDSLHEEERNQVVKGVSRAEAYYAKKQKTTNLIDRMVEDMIQSSMKQGGFRNLKGAGKPLKKDETNPYIDDMEMRINKILIRNGFSPPWIMKETEIRDDLNFLREEIRFERAVFLKTRESGERRWNDAVERFQTTVERVNKAIRDFNLIVPSLSRQIFPLNAENELKKALDDVASGGEDSKWMKKASQLFDKWHTVEPTRYEENHVFRDFLKELRNLWRINRS
uniref:J domain-containing protein n=1 Tax=Steinernema glaseri TaxID=37863 RepID=A0A1I7ZUG9_9BILA